jgi:hypothetical protein
LKPNTNMFDIDFCRYGKPKEETEKALAEREEK